MLSIQTSQVNNYSTTFWIPNVLKSTLTHRKKRKPNKKVKKIETVWSLLMMISPHEILFGCGYQAFV